VIAQLTVVIPVLHDDGALANLLARLRGVAACVVVDGGGSSATAALVYAQGAQYLSVPPSRGGQIAAGIAAARTDWLWVVHADSIFSEDVPRAIVDVLRAEPCWGCFAVRIPGVSLVAWFMNRRTRITKICTGDQSLLMHRSLLRDVGGYPEQPLMEDIEVSSRLRRAHPDRFRFLQAPITTSAKRWQTGGRVRTVLRMWAYRWRYYRGASPHRLYRDYYGLRSEEGD